ncbi:MAG: transposase [Bradyrhizobium sp.]
MSTTTAAEAAFAISRVMLPEPHPASKIRMPNKRRGVPRVDNRRVLNGIFWVLRSGSPWADVPERYGPPITIYNRFNHWRKAGI